MRHMKYAYPFKRYAPHNCLEAFLACALLEIFTQQTNINTHYIYMRKSTIILLSLLAAANVFAAAGFNGENGSILDLSGVDFNTSEIVYNNDAQEYSDQNGAMYKDLYLTNSRFDAVDLTNASFAGKDLSGAYFAESYLENADFTGAIIANTDFDLVSFTKAQLMSTKSFADKNLEGFDLGNAAYSKSGRIGVNDLSGVNFSGFNLRDTGFAYVNFSGTNFTGADFTGASFTKCDFRGATGIAESVMSTNSYVWTDGVIKHNGIAGLKNHSIVISKHDSIAARFTANSTVAEMIFSAGAEARVESGVTVSYNTGYFFTDESGSGKFIVDGVLDVSESYVNFINIADDFDREGYYVFQLVELGENGSIVGSFEKDSFMVGSLYPPEGVFVAYDGLWDIYQDETGVYITFGTIPEPSTYAAIFGALALAFAAYRRRK